MLLIDAGNTRVKWALADAAGGAPSWQASGASSHAQLEQLAADWTALAQSRVIDSVHVANVAGAAMAERLRQLIHQSLGETVELHWFASAPARAGIDNCYRDYRQLGCDRLASMIGAHALFPAQALLVVTCGTATTIDAVTAEGRFTGGMILPGLGLMAQALARNTAQLPQVAPEHCATLFADNTDSAIAGGCLAAQVGAIEHACRELAARLHPTPVQCILSGGAAPYIGPHLEIGYRPVENLVLTGLYVDASWQEPGSGAG